MLNPRDVHEIGVKLCDPAAEEAARRSGISRCYYGCFLIARKITNLEDVKSAIHEKVPLKLDEMGHRKLAQDLRTLSDARKKCDYDIYKTVPGKEAQSMKSRSKKLITKLEEILNQ